MQHKCDYGRQTCICYFGSKDISKTSKGNDPSIWFSWSSGVSVHFSAADYPERNALPWASSALAEEGLLAAERRHLAEFHSACCQKKSTTSHTGQQQITKYHKLQATCEHVHHYHHQHFTPAWRLPGLGKSTGGIVRSSSGGTMTPPPSLTWSSLTASRGGRMRGDETAQGLHWSIIKSASNTEGEWSFVSAQAKKCSNLWEATHNTGAYRHFCPQQTFLQWRTLRSPG